MNTQEIVQFFLQKGLIIDKEVLGLLSEGADTESAKLMLERLQQHMHKRMITKSLIIEHREQVRQVFSSLPHENQKKLEQFKVRLGLHLEISREVSYASPSAGSPAPVQVKSLLGSEGKKFTVSDFVTHFRNRFKDMRGFLQTHAALGNVVSLGKLSSARQGVSVIGMVSDKRVTKNKNIIFDIEDLSGRAKVLVNHSKEDLLKKAEEVALDGVVGFTCSGSKDMLFANDIIFPALVLGERKHSPVDEYVAFLGDVHYGSKKFMEKNFLHFIDYLNGKLPDTPEVSRIKYLVIIGDLITGVGAYPNQEQDLVITDLEEQFSGIARLLGKIRKDVQIVICPGNHEGVRLMEPQPLYDPKYAWALHDMANVTLVENPALVTIGAREGFSGFSILMYHGFSYPFYADNVPRLMQMKAMNAPENIMMYLLQQRHLAPTHGSVQYFPSERDSHVIREVPDIFFSGHTHKSAVTYFNNILVVSASTWEELTAYQEKFGNVPDHCKVPLFNLKTRAVKIMDFE